MENEYKSFINALIGGIAGNSLSKPSIETIFALLLIILFVLLNNKFNTPKV